MTNERIERAPLHVVFGAGQVGTQLAHRLRDQGHRVRVVRRSARAVGRGIEVVAGDARDAGFAAEASRGADVIYHCMNPSAYTARAWRAELPALGEALIGAAQTHGARLVVLDNLYAYGPREDRVTEETPMTPTGPKCEVRARWAERLARASAEGVRMVAGRAGDFFGPGASSALVSEEAVRGLLDGKRPWLIGDPRAPHAFSYIPDVVEALAALGNAEPDVEGRVFHLPVHEIPPAELFARIGETLGVEVRPRRSTKTAFVLMSPFVGLCRELLETFYQWDRPFLVDDRAFRARFPDVGASLEEAVAGAAGVTSPLLTPESVEVTGAPT